MSLNNNYWNGKEQPRESSGGFSREQNLNTLKTIEKKLHIFYNERKQLLRYYGRWHWFPLLAHQSS